MKDNVVPWPHAGGVMKAPPVPMLRPADWSLRNAVQALETQLGTIEAYNRLVDAARALRVQIEAGDAKPQNPLYAIDPRGAAYLPRKGR